jgi:hypothetical protein
MFVLGVVARLYVLTTSWVVDDVLYDTTNVTVSLSIVEGTELGWGLVQTGVGSWKKRLVTVEVDAPVFSVISIAFFSLASAHRHHRIGDDLLKIEPRPFLWLRMTLPIFQKVSREVPEVPER